MQPSSWRTLAIATLSLEDGITTVGFSTICALRMRVSMSAIGSLMLMRMLLGVGAPPPSPAGLHDAGDVAPEREVADHVAAQAELAERPARAARDPAAVALSGRV